MNHMLMIKRLPDDIIANILDRLPETIFSDPSLSNRKAAPYALLSKAFYEAFKKRPVCYFDASSDSKTSHDEEYKFFCLKFGKHDFHHVQQLEAFRITFGNSNYVQFIDQMTKPWKSQRLKTLNLRYLNREDPLTKFPESVFSMKSLEELGLKGWSLDKEPERITWPKLKRLCLESVSMIWTLFRDVMESSSPSLENLVIRDFKEPWKNPGYRMLVLKNLKTLHLEKYEGINDSFFTDFSKQFPQVEELCLQECPNSRIGVKSSSLKKVRLVNMLLLKEVSFDAPNVVQFEFEGKYKGKSNINLPKVSVKTRSEEGWTSVIKLVYSKGLITEKELEKFKACFSESKSSFCLNHNWLR